MYILNSFNIFSTLLFTLKSICYKGIIGGIGCLIGEIGCIRGEIGC